MIPSCLNNGLETNLENMLLFLFIIIIIIVYYSFLLLLLFAGYSAKSIWLVEIVHCFCFSFLLFSVLVVFVFFVAMFYLCLDIQISSSCCISCGSWIVMVWNLTTCLLFDSEFAISWLSCSGLQSFDLLLDYCQVLSEFGGTQFQLLFLKWLGRVLPTNQKL